MRQHLGLAVQRGGVEQAGHEQQLGQRHARLEHPVAEALRLGRACVLNDTRLFRRTVQCRSRSEPAIDLLLAARAAAPQRDVRPGAEQRESAPASTGRTRTAGRAAGRCCCCGSGSPPSARGRLTQAGDGKARQRRLVEGRHEAEAALHPALEHRAGRAVRIQPPALQQLQVARRASGAARRRCVAPRAGPGRRPGSCSARTRRAPRRRSRSAASSANRPGLRLARAGDVQRLRMRVEGRARQQRRRHADQVGRVPARAGRLHDRPPARLTRGGSRSGCAPGPSASGPRRR